MKQAVAFVIAVLVAAPALRAADDPLLTVSGQSGLRSLLVGKVALVTVTPRPEPMQDVSFIPKRYGMGACVLQNGGAVLLTSLPLARGAARIEVEPARGGVSKKAAVGSRYNGLVALRCKDTTACCGITAVDPAPPGSADAGRSLFFATPAGGGRWVLGHTVSRGPVGGDLGNLVAVPGKLNLGTPLFDSSGRIVAVVVRPSADRGDSLAAVVSEAKQPR